MHSCYLLHLWRISIVIKMHMCTCSLVLCMHTVFLIKQIVSPSHFHIACAGAGAASDISSVAVAAATGGFIGGVLLTAVIGGVVAVAVFCRVKRELTAATTYRLVYMLHACMSVQEMRMHNIYTCTHVHGWINTLI